MTDTNQKNQLWAKLPEEIRAVLNSDESVATIESIGARQGANEMEQGFLVRICSNLMKGLLAPADFVNTIATELDLPRDKAAYIAQEINRDIFSNIKDALKTVHARNSDMEIDPKHVNCLPEQNKNGVGIPSGNVAKPEPTGSILEQKLGGTFRIQSQVARTTGAPDPMLIVPPAPQRTAPTQPPASSSSDPYRELAA